MAGNAKIDGVVYGGEDKVGASALTKLFKSRTETTGFDRDGYTEIIFNSPLEQESLREELSKSGFSVGLEVFSTNNNLEKTKWVVGMP